MHPKNPPWLQPLGLLITMLLGGIFLAGIFLVPFTSTRPPEGYDQSRMHWNTKNSTRFNGDSLASVSRLVNRAVYPATSEATRPDVVLLYEPDNWQAGLRAASLLKPLNAVLIPASDDIQAMLEAIFAQ